MTQTQPRLPRRIGLLVAAAVGGVGLLWGAADAGPAGKEPRGDEAGRISQTSWSAGVERAASVADQPLKLDYGRLDARLKQVMAEPDMVGLAVGIVEGGRIRFIKGYGLTSADGSEPVTADTVFRWASLSKGVAGTLVAELAREGRVSLDAPVARYRTSLRLPGGAETRVTVADVLSHRVGVVRNAYDEKLEEGQDPRAIRSALATLPPYCAPGTCYTYQNIAFDAATEVVEHATGRRYDDLAREKLFAPLGMASASVGRGGLENSPSWARPHRGRHVLPTKDAYYRVPAAGGVNSSIFDLAKWMRAQMGAGRVLSADMLLAAHTPIVVTPPRGRRGAIDRALAADGYGLGWRTLSYAGHRLVGHRGAVDGYRSLILFDPETKAGIAMLWNSNSNKPVGLQLEMLDMLYRLPAQEWMRLGDTIAPEPAAPLAVATPRKDGRRRPGVRFGVSAG